MAELNAEEIGQSLVQYGNDELQRTHIGQFWECYVGPFNVWVEPPNKRYPFSSNGGLYANVRMTKPVIYLSPLAGAPC